MAGPSDNDLAAQVEDLAVNVRGLRETLRLKFYTARKSIRLSIGVAAVGAAVNLALVAWVWHWVSDYRAHQQANTVISCLNMNASRQALERRLEQMGETLVDVFSNAQPATTDNAARLRAEIVARVKADLTAGLRGSVPPELGQRDCSPDAVTSPTLVGR